MKKLLSLAVLLQGTLVSPSTLTAMEKEAALPLLQPVISLYNTLGKSITLQVTTQLEEGMKEHTVQEVDSGQHIRLPQPIRGLSIQGKKIPSNQLCALEDFSEIIVSRVSQEEPDSLKFEINIPHSLRVVNTYEKIILVTYKKTDSSSRTIDDYRKGIYPRLTGRIKQPVFSLSIVDSELEGSALPLVLEDHLLTEAADFHAEILVYKDPQTGKLSYAFNRTKCHSIIQAASLEDFSSHEEEENSEVTQRGTGMDIHSGDQKNCILS